MNLKKKHINLIAAVAFAFPGLLAGQSSIDLNFQGMLADIQGKRIGNESFDLYIQVLKKEGSDLLWEVETSAKTDEAGWFEFTVSDISRYLLKEGQIREPVTIRMEFTPNSGTRWMRQGEDFMVSYTLTPTIVENSIQMEMTRMEGSELVVHQEEHLFAFKDLYPFAFLTGGFLLTDRPPVSESSIKDLRHWLSPEGEVHEGAASRGIKGGFAAGGYRKKN